jgi:hypothetical protein
MTEDLTRKLPQTDSEKLTLIINRLDKVEETLEQRLYDTRPIWQKVVADIAHLQKGQDALRATQDTLSADVGEIKKSMRDVYYRFDVLNNTMLAIRADHRDLCERVQALENHSNPPNSET